jgi:hypothetical protein
MAMALEDECTVTYSTAQIPVKFSLTAMHTINLPFWLLVKEKLVNFCRAHKQIKVVKDMLVCMYGA